MSTITTTFNVAGMTCAHCVGAVSAEVGKIDGVQAVDIDLVTGGQSAVRVTSAAELAIADVREAVDEAGYELTGVSA